MLLVGITLKRMVDQRARDRRFEESESEYIETLQVTESEDEAHELLRRQVERSVEGARAVVLVRNNSADRLQAKTPLSNQIDALRDPLMGATPRSAWPFALVAATPRRPRTISALLSCEICGGLPGASTCEPLLVGGEVIGVVLISSSRRARGEPRQRIRETVAQAAPVLANLRNLAIAQLHAATDGLTGLPNRRAVQDTLKRMVAQSVAGSARSRRCCWISTTSRTSTTPSATTKATRFLPRSASLCATPSATATSLGATEARSSCCCSREPTSRPRRGRRDGPQGHRDDPHAQPQSGHRQHRRSGAA